MLTEATDSDGPVSSPASLAAEVHALRQALASCQAELSLAKQQLEQSGGQTPLPAGQSEPVGDRLWRELMDLLPVRIGVLNREQRYVYVNTTAAQAFERPPAQILGKTPGELFPNDQGQRLASLHQQATQGQSSVAAQPGYWELTVHPVTGGYTIEIGQEVPSSPRYEQLANLITDPILLYDQQLRYVFVNQALARITGIPASDFVGKTYSEVMGNQFPAQFEKRAAACQRVMQTGLAESYRDSITIQGNTRYSEIFVYPGPNGGTLLLIRDITAQVLAERQYQELAESISDPVILYDKDLRYQYLNQGAERLLGCKAEQARGKTIAEVRDAEYLRQGKRIWEAYQQVLLSRNQQSLTETVVIQGRKIVAEVNIYPAIGGGILMISRNITDRVNADEQYRDLAQSIADVFFALDHERCITYWNPACEQSTGIPAGQVLGKPLYEFFPDVQDGPVDHLYRRVLQSKAPDSLTESFLLGNERHYFDLRVYPTPDGIAVLARDITQTKQLEQQLQQQQEELQASLQALQSSETFLRTIIEAEPEGVQLIDPQGCWLSMNQSGLAMLEAVSPAQLLGSPAIERVAREDQPAFNQLLADVLAGNKGKLTFQVQGLRGTRRWVEMHAVPLRDQTNQHTAVLGITRDISDSFGQERRLEELRLRLEGIIQSAMDAIITVDEAFEVILFNTAAEKMFGYQPDEVLAAPLDQLIPARFRGAHASHLRHYALTHRTVRMMQPDMPIFGVRKDGTEFPIEASISQLQVADKKFFTVIIRDITQRIKANRQLEEEKQRLELALMGGNLGLWDWEIPTGKVTINPRWARMLGYAPEEINPRYSAWEELMHPLDAPAVNQLLQTHLAGSSPYYQTEFRLRGKDGQWKWILSSGRVIERDQAGNPLRAVGTHLDISPQKEAQQTSQFQAQLLELVDEGIVSLTRDQRIRTWSAGAAKIFGITTPEALGKELAEILTVEHYPNGSHPASFTQTLEQPHWKGEVVIRTCHGQAHAIFLTVSHFTDVQGEPGYILVCKDIEEISAVQHQLIQQQAYILSIIENSADAIFALDEHFNLLYFNSAYAAGFAELFGRQPVAGDNLSQLAGEKGRQQMKQDWAQISQGQHHAYDYTYVTETGVGKYFEVSIHPIYDANRQVVGVSYLHRDVTEKKQIAQQMQGMQTEILENKIKEQWLQASALLEGQELERKRLGRELHDGLGQLLNVLKMHLVRENVSPATLQLTNEVLAEVVRMNNDLMPLVLQDFGLSAGLRQLVEKYRSVTSAELYFYCDLESTRMAAEVEMAVFRMVQETLSNAVKYAQAQHISIQVTAAEQNLLIMVEDDGVGFRPEATMKRNGRGFGLLNVKFRAEALRGLATIESKPGKGCLVTIEIPI